MSNMTGETEQGIKKLLQQAVEKDEDSERIVDANLPTANIIVAGITGTGKSTLINAVFDEKMAATGKGRPVTEHIDEYWNENIPIHIWDTVGLELDSQKTRESINSIKSTIASKVSSSDKYDRIHAIWYCINSGSNRYQGAELEFIKELHAIGVPFIIVLTQCFGDENEVNAFEAEIKKCNVSMGMSDIRIVQVLACPVKFRGMPTEMAAFGLDELVKVTLEMMPEFIKSGFIAAQKVCQSEKRKAGEKIIYAYVERAQRGFWDKVPIVNVFLTDSNIVNMFKQLGKMYNMVFSEGTVERVMNGAHVDLPNKFWGLISPIDMGYSKKIMEFLEKKKIEDEYKTDYNFEKIDRAARMTAFYGYIFIDSVEELWKVSTEEQLANIDTVCGNLMAIINEKIYKRAEMIGRRQYGNNKI